MLCGMSIKCCVLNLEPLYNEELYKACLSRLPDYGYWRVRKDKMSKFRFQEDKIRSLGAGLLLLHVLQKNGIECGTIECNAYGKPFVCNSDFQFNLSHSGNYAVCSYGNGESGIDVECYQSADLEIAERFFEQHEAQLVKEYGEKMFVRLWSLKESYIKAEGKGLGIRLDSFRICPSMIRKIDYSNEKFISTIANESYVNSDARFHFAEFIIDDFHISVCSKNMVEEKMEVLEIL